VSTRRTIALLLVSLAPAGSAAAQVAPLPGELTGAPPWPANNGPTLLPRLVALGLPALAQEGTRLHIHAHLDVFVSGRRVVVPAGIGIDRDLRFIAPLHTHDATGIVHVESPTVRTFTLAEFLGVWGVRFRGRPLRVFANGRRVTSPERLVLRAHEEIVLAFGTRLPRPLPTRYTFPPGL